ncbi:MAG: TRAP transporter large permease subunit [Dehalococcoidia bacterium]|jgi:tripartite ATP-independent transporter DctM subunit|nr:TRAP transporter large permease subunit [Dehalococcoidia bacterium]
MIDASPEIITIVMFGLLILLVGSGFPLGLALGGVALIAGLLFWNQSIFSLFYDRLFGVTTNYTFLAVPLFIFMGIMVEKSGMSAQLFNSLYLWLGGVRGGLAVATIWFGTILAATVGVIAASVTMLGLIALPSMLQRGYAKGIATGACTAGGSLGILIPPSIMLIIYGPMANISVGKLFMSAFPAGLTLSLLYTVYILVRCALRPNEAPVMPPEERNVPLQHKLRLLFVALLPPVLLVLAVLGSIFFGIAAPTEAAAVGALASALMAAAYRKLNLRVLKETCFTTAGTFSMVFIVVVGATFFTSVFLGLGCGQVVNNFVLAAPGGKWGVFFIIMFIVFLLGMLIDWIGIVLIMVPIVTPIAAQLGFDPLWFSMMLIVNLQMSFLSPPFAYAIFFLQAICKPEWNISSADIIRGSVPFIGVIVLALVLMAVFPEIITWLPAQMIK